MSDRDKIKSIKLYLEMFHGVIEQLDKLSDEERKEILSGDVSVNITLRKKNGVKKNRKPILDLDKFNEIESYLRSLENREDGKSYIERNLFGKETLKVFAKHLDLPVTKEDSTDRIINKIIEGTIGYRLRSRAIQDFKLK